MTSTPPPATHAHSRADACSVQWDQAAVPALGTASVARFWVALEQPGPWGREAATQSHLDPATGQELDRLCTGEGGRFTLIRRPGGHADAHHGGGVRVYVAGGLEGHPWLLEADLELPEELGRLPWSDLARGDLDAVQEALPTLEEAGGPVLMVCTNGRRDVCCAVRGRPVALEAAARRPGRVWECSHTGGHRFAPTGVLLPYGQTWARLDATLATEALDAATHGQVPAALLGATHDRGRSALRPAAQAAESLVREQAGETSLTALTAREVGSDAAAGVVSVQVDHRDGRTWTVSLRRSELAGDRPESCGKAAVPTVVWQAVT